jgi:hydroxymethylbilane synthase
MARSVRLTILSRASRLARLQAALVERALRAAHPGIEIVCATRAAAGDRDQATALWQMGDKGAFTADLSEAVRHAEADIVVHSWMDLRFESPPFYRLSSSL